MNAPPGFESDPEVESESEDDALPVATPSKDTPKFSWTALIKEPGAESRQSKKISLSSLMPTRRPSQQGLIEDLNDELNEASPPASPQKLKTRPPLDLPTPTLESLAALLQDSPPDRSQARPATPPAARPPPQQPSTARPDDHSAELGKFLGVLGQFLTQGMEASKQAQPQLQVPAVTASTTSTQHWPSPPPGWPAQVSSPQHRPTWIPTHAPTLAAYDAYWPHHPPLPAFPPQPPMAGAGPGSPRTQLPGFSTQPPTPGYPPPFYPHPTALLPYHPHYGENRPYYGAPMSPGRLHAAEEYLPNPCMAPSQHQPATQTDERRHVDTESEGDAHPVSRSKSLVRRMMGFRSAQVSQQVDNHASDSGSGRGEGSTIETVLTCLVIAKELHHALRKADSRHQRVEQSLSALHRLINILREHRDTGKSGGVHQSSARSNDLMEDVFRYLKSLVPHLTPALIAAVIYLVKDWLENGFSMKGLLKSATAILEELNGMKPRIQAQSAHQGLQRIGEDLLQRSMQAAQAQPPRPVSPEGSTRLTRPPPVSLGTAEPKAATSSRPHRAPPPSQQLASLEMEPRRSSRRDRPPLPASTISYRDLDTSEANAKEPATSKPRGTSQAAPDRSPGRSNPLPESSRAADSRMAFSDSPTRDKDPVTRDKGKAREAPFDPDVIPVPPPRSTARPSQSALEALKAKQRREYERLKQSVNREKTVHLRPVGNLPEEDVKVHDGIAELNEGIAKVKPGLRRVESDLQAARELAHADSGPRREPVDDATEEKDGPTVKQVEEARDLMRQPTPLRGVIAAHDVQVEPTTAIEDANGAPQGVQAEPVFYETSRPVTPISEPIEASRPATPVSEVVDSTLATPGPGTPLESPIGTPSLTPTLEPSTPLETPGGSPLVFPVFGSEPLDIDDIRDEVEDAHEMERIQRLSS